MRNDAIHSKVIIIIYKKWSRTYLIRFRQQYYTHNLAPIQRMRNTNNKYMNNIIKRAHRNSGDSSESLLHSRTLKI